MGLVNVVGAAGTANARQMNHKISGSLGMRGLF